MKRYYCNGKKGFCDRGNDGNIDCSGCEFTDGTGGNVVENAYTNFERIKDMSIEEMAAFLKSMVDDNETHKVGCYGCINYGTHHSDPQNKENGLYECEGCYCEGVGHDLVKWLEREVEE
jgi:hypothetical protein